VSAIPTAVLALGEAYHRAVRDCDLVALRAVLDAFPYPMAECNTCLGPSGPMGEVEGADGRWRVCADCEGWCLFWGREPLRLDGAKEAA
jgi:hypothetical protein